MSNFKINKPIKKQQMTKASKTKPLKPSTVSRRARLMKLVKRHKLVTILLVILFLWIYPSLLQSYKAWENARLIRGMFRDYPLIVQEVERATGMDLEYDVECSVTTEKFGNGVNTCEFVLAGDFQRVKDLIESSIIQSKILGGASLSKYENGLTLKYQRKNACFMRTKEFVSFSCIIPIKNENITLARQLYENQKE